MINKIYEDFKKTIKENYKIIISFIIILLIMTVEFPYYIEAPGGIINVDDRVEIASKNESKGSFNLAYVKEIKATIPTLIYASLNKNWDIMKVSDVKYDNETIKDVDYRNRLLLEEANNNATVVAYSHAHKNISLNNQSLYITYIDDEAETDLKIGDELLKINSVDIIDKKQLDSIIKEHNIGDNLIFTVKRNNKVIECFARLRNIDNNKIVGLVLSKISDLELNPELKLKFRNSESGPSGGLITALSIYNGLIEDDITGGKKIVGTGTIDENGSVGSIGGLEYKIKGAIKENAEIFLVPVGENYDDAKRIVDDNDYDILLIPVESFDDALEKLKYIK